MKDIKCYTCNRIFTLNLDDPVYLATYQLGWRNGLNNYDYCCSKECYETFKKKGICNLIEYFSNILITGLIVFLINIPAFLSIIHETSVFIKKLVLLTSQHHTERLFIGIFSTYNLFNIYLPPYTDSNLVR